jgi:hypothetical protein
MASLKKKSFLKRIKAELNVPENYHARLRAQLKRYENTKSPEELRDHILADWKHHATELREYWDAAESIHNDFLGELVQKRVSLEMQIQEREEVNDFLFSLCKEGCKALFHDRRIATLKEYISIGINPEQAGEMVMDTDRHYDTQAIEKHITEEYKKWQNREY